MSSQGGHTRRRPVLALLALAVALGIVPIAPAQGSSDGWGYGHGPIAIKCIQLGENGVAFAHVDSSMYVRNRGGGRHWVTNFRMKARLIPTTTGLNWSRGWKTKRFPVFSELFQDRNYDKTMAVNTDTVNPEADWNVQVKMIWSRAVPWRDLVQEFTLHFDTSRCQIRKGDEVRAS